VATFELAEDEMEVGVGIHGERGRELMTLSSADEIVALLSKAIDDDLKLTNGQQVLLHINGFGATPMLELYLVYDIAERFLADKGVHVTRSLVGNYTTSLEMAGCSITVTKLDDELTHLWDAPVHTASLRWGM
ncbi:hypothetical protein LCGC14_1538470, partial [marine sediment metagenome]